MSKKNSGALETQVDGSHYKNLKIQPVEFCQINGLRTCESNVIKYVSRHRNKNGFKDLKKAYHYLKLLIQIEKSDLFVCGVARRLEISATYYLTANKLNYYEGRVVELVCAHRYEEGFSMIEEALVAIKSIAIEGYPNKLIEFGIE